MRIQSAQPDYDAINKKVEAEFCCTHTETTCCKKVKADSQIEIRNQCRHCGDKVGNAVRKATMTDLQIEALPIWDDRISAQFAKLRSRFYLDTLNREKARLLADWRKRYDIYLESPEWKQRRQLVMLRAQGICEGCRLAQAADVHHLNYEDVGEEFLFQLVALCRKCHQRWHQPEPPGFVPPATQQ